MISSPFALFRQFEDVEVFLFQKEDVLTTDQALLRAIQDSPLITLDQVHGNETVIVDAPSLSIFKADGALSKAQNLTLAIRVADCQCFVAYAPKQKVIGVLHAGWKGLLNGMIPEFFKTLERVFYARPDEVFVGLGPSLCLHCSEFTDPVQELPGIDPKFFDGRLVDLQGIADAQLDAAGVPVSQRERMSDCTRCRNDLYWSYRGGDREAVKQGARNVLTIRKK